MQYSDPNRIVPDQRTPSESARILIPDELRRLVAPRNILQFGESPTVLLIGESHGDPEQMQLHCQIIAALKPQYLLHECAGPFHYESSGRFVRVVKGSGPSLDEMERKQIDPRFNRMLPVLAQIKADLIGIDAGLGLLEGNERRIAIENPRVYRWNGVLMLRADPKECFTPQSGESTDFRDRYMATQIRAYAAFSNRPIIAIVGEAHAANIDEKGLLLGHGVSYLRMSTSETAI